MATTSSLVTNCLNPIFADIDAQTLNINPNIIENMLETSEFADHNDFDSLIDNDNEIRISTKNYIKHKYL